MRDLGFIIEKMTGLKIHICTQDWREARIHLRSGTPVVKDMGDVIYKTGDTIAGQIAGTSADYFGCSQSRSNLFHWLGREAGDTSVLRIVSASDLRQRGTVGGAGTGSPL